MPQLHLQSGTREGEVIELTGEIITIGSAPGNMIELEAADMEPFHATLVWDDGDYVLCDQQSGAGTFVNGVKIEEQKLVAGDQVFLGSVSMLYASHIPQPDTPAMRLFVPPSPAPAAFTPGTRIPMPGHRGTVPTAPPPAKAKGASPWLRLVVLALVIFVAVELVLLQRKPWQAKTTGAVPSATPAPVPGQPEAEAHTTTPPAATPTAVPPPSATDAPAPDQPSTPATSAPRTGEAQLWAVIIRDSGILPAGSEPAALQLADTLRADFQLGDEAPLTVMTSTLALPKPVSPNEITARFGPADSIRRGVPTPDGTDRLFDHHLYGKLALLVDAQTGFVEGFSVPSAWWKGGLRGKAVAALGGSEIPPSPPTPAVPAAAGDTTMAPPIPGAQPQLPAGDAALRYRWRSPDAGPPVSAAGITVKEVIVNGARVPEIKGAPGAKGVVPFVGNKRPIDLPGSKDIRIKIDPVVRQTSYAGLAFMAPCVVEILADGTLVADRENIRTTDKGGKAWVTRRCILNGQTVIAFLP